MAVTRRKEIIGEKDRGIALTVLLDKKFKTNSFIVHFISELTEENAAANAAVSFMLDSSSKEYPDITSLSRRLAGLYGANIRSGISRFADSSVVTVSGGCIADKYALGGEEISYELLKTLLGCIFEPAAENGAFPQKEFELKKQELIDDIDSDINDKRNFAFKKAGKVIFRKEPAGIAVKGEREAAAALTSKQVYRAYEKLIKTAKIEIFFVGSEFPEKCGKLLKEKFGSIKRENVYSPGLLPSPCKAAPEEVTDRLDVAQSKMVLAFKTDMDNKAVSKMFAVIFGASPFSLLFKNVRERLSLCYYCSCSISNHKRVIYVDSGVEQENITAARNEILNQLKAAAGGDFPDELMLQAKLLTKSTLQAAEDYPMGIADWYFGYCLDSEEETVSPAEMIKLTEKVTKEDVCRYAASMKLDTVYVLTGKEND